VQPVWKSMRCNSAAENQPLWPTAVLTVCLPPFAKSAKDGAPSVGAMPATSRPKGGPPAFRAQNLWVGQPAARCGPPAKTEAVPAGVVFKGRKQILSQKGKLSVNPTNQTTSYTIVRTIGYSQNVPRGTLVEICLMFHAERLGRTHERDARAYIPTAPPYRLELRCWRECSVRCSSSAGRHRR